MEFIAKIIFTFLVVLVGAKILHWTWTSHIDLKATVSNLVTQEPKIADKVVTREPNKLYQNGIAVADVTGFVKNKNGSFLFTQLTNASGLDRSQPFEYKRLKLKVTHVQTFTGMKINGSSVLQHVMEGVTCEELR